MISGSWFRMAPEDSSTPLQTMSYCQPRMSSGSWVSRASRPPCGIENGLCEKSIPPVSSSFSYIGKSTIQQKRNTPSSKCPARRAASTRTAPMIFETSSNSPAPKNTACPAASDRRLVSSATFSSVRNFAIGPVSEPSSVTRTHARPFAPSEIAYSPSWSKNLRGRSWTAGTGSARTCLPANALNSEPSKTSVMSTSSSWARRSGLSEPYFSIASRNGIRGKGEVT